MPYSDFSKVYDRLMQGADYPALCDRYLKLLAMHSHTPRLSLDAACGTGAFTFELVRRGIDVIGVDCSPEMLNIARERLGADALLLCQRLEDLDLFGTIDTVFCTLDGLNHITDKEELIRSLRRIALFLEPSGKFIFDLNTVYKHQTVLGDNTFVIEDEDIYAVWSNEYCGGGLSRMELDFFVEQEDGRYQRFSECIEEQAYEISEFEKMLENSGFKTLGIYDFDNGSDVRQDSEKIIFVAERI